MLTSALTCFRQLTLFQTAKFIEHSSCSMNLRRADWEIPTNLPVFADWEIPSPSQALGTPGASQHNRARLTNRRAAPRQKSVPGVRPVTMASSSPGPWSLASPSSVPRVGNNFFFQPSKYAHLSHFHAPSARREPVTSRHESSRATSGRGG